MSVKIDFNEEQINALFGNLAAEDEPAKRFEMAFFKSDIYEKIHNQLPLRILVAHKGIGKSAIFRMSYLENINKNIQSLWIRPDDIADLGISGDADTALELIRKWKSGLRQRIVELILSNYELNIDDERVKKGIKTGVKLIESITSVIKIIDEHINLDPVKKITVQKYLQNNRVVIYIDDLDRAWNGTKANIDRIAALLNAVRDLSNESDGLCFRISLRSDVYFLVRTADESTDKIDGNVLWLNWTEHQLLVLLAKRVQSYFGNTISQKELMKKPQFEIVKHLYSIMDECFMGDGKWHEKPVHYILLSLIRRRPRDLINLCTLAARCANENNHTKIMTEDWERIFEQYSLSRLQDTINEHRYELPDIERLLLGMKPSKKDKKMVGSFLYDEENLLKKVEGIMQKGKFYFSNGNEASDKELIAFMYKINFLVGRKDASDGYVDRKYFEENKYLSTSYADFGYQWEVHPAYRWALYPESRDIFSDLDIPALV